MSNADDDIDEAPREERRNKRRAPLDFECAPPPPVLRLPDSPAAAVTNGKIVVALPPPRLDQHSFTFPVTSRLMYLPRDCFNEIWQYSPYGPMAVLKMIASLSIAEAVHLLQPFACNRAFAKAVLQLILGNTECAGTSLWTCAIPLLIVCPTLLDKALEILVCAPASQLAAVLQALQQNNALDTLALSARVTKELEFSAEWFCKMRKCGFDAVHSTLRTLVCFCKLDELEQALLPEFTLENLERIAPSVIVADGTPLHHGRFNRSDWYCNDNDLAKIHEELQRWIILIEGGLYTTKELSKSLRRYANAKCFCNYRSGGTEEHKSNDDFFGRCKRTMCVRLREKFVTLETVALGALVAKQANVTFMVQEDDDDDDNAAVDDDVAAAAAAT